MTAGRRAIDLGFPSVGEGVTVNDERPFFATAAKGTEGALRDELRELRVPKVRADRGGVHFGGDLGIAMRVCLRSRIAVRVLWRLGIFEADDGDALYAGTRAIDWSEWLDSGRTLSVSATVKHGGIRHSGFAAQRLKDAVVDQLRERTGARPDVARHDPDVHIVTHVARDQAQVFVDLAGRSLSRRGYRKEWGDAPLKEHLAAALLRLAGYRPGAPLLDPMCGAGTIPIEGALWAAALAPGAKRTFGFERWRCFDDAARAMWAVEQERAVRFARPVETEVAGSDRDRLVLRHARANAARAGVTVSFARADLATVSSPSPGGFLVMNPPYGVRVERDAGWRDEFRRVLGRWRDATVVVITAERDLPRAAGRRADAEHTLFNGDVECRLFTWKPQ